MSATRGMLALCPFNLQDPSPRTTARLFPYPLAASAATAQFYCIILPFSPCPGFIAKNNAGQVTTLKRNGSDYSATILGALFRVSGSFW